MKEQQKWEAWEQQDSRHSRLRKQAQQLYELPMDANRNAETSEQLRRLNKRIDEYKSGPKLLSRPSNSLKYKWLAAAIIALTVGVLAVLKFAQRDSTSQTSKPIYSTTQVGYGESGSIKLSDGSMIRLNAHSSLRYNPSGFDSKNVEVWLKGEAYFSIAHPTGKNERVFTVHTTDGDIQVLGTKFNVNTQYEHTGVVLEKGKVALTLRDSLHNKLATAVMHPGQRAIMDTRNDTIPLQTVDPSLYTAWLQGKLKFDRSSLREIIRRIETTYGVSIAVADNSLLDKKISGSIQNPDLQTLISGLEQALKLDFIRQSKAKYLVSRE